MSNPAFETAVTIAGFSCTVIGTWIGVSKYYHARLNDYVERQTEASKKAYAAERDFGHIKRNLEQLQEGQKYLTGDFEHRLDKLEQKLSKLDMFVSMIAARAGQGAISSLFRDDAPPE